MLEPLLELVPAAFDGVQFGKFRREVPHAEFITTQARDRTVSDSFRRSFPGDVLPEIACPEVACSVEKHHQLVTEALFQRL
jgi:hypothetical protein